MKSNYWFEKRSEKRLVNSEKLGNDAILEVEKIYGQALKNLTKEINSVYANYSKQTGLDVSELSQILNGSDRKKFLLSIQEQMRNLGFRLEDVYKPEYIARISRLEALKQQIYWEIKNISPKEFEATTQKYSQIVKNTYESMTYDVEIANGVKPSFATLDTPMVNQLLREDWQGRNYSESIWKNTNKLVNGDKNFAGLPTIIGGALMSGASQQKTNKLLREGFQIGEYEATRLIRTETNHFNNQAELQSYADMGIERYQFYAVMDKLTSEICRNHDGQIYDLDEAVEGENYPPLHPNCRSTTIPILEGEGKFTGRRRSQTIDAEGNELPEEERFQERNVVDTTWNKTVNKWSKENANKDIEYGAIISRTSGDVIEKSRGNYGEINFTLRQLRELEGNILIHNHPYTGSKTNFSPSDVVIPLNRGAYETIVVGREGKYHMRFGDITDMSKSKRFQISEDIKSTYIDYLKRYSDSSDISSNLWELISKKYGFTYWSDSL